ncbi:MAG: hypothetical protein RR504_06880 [Christensenellaceae bacterium]
MDLPISLPFLYADSTIKSIVQIRTTQCYDTPFSYPPHCSVSHLASLPQEPSESKAAAGKE